MSSVEHLNDISDQINDLKSTVKQVNKQVKSFDERFKSIEDAIKILSVKHDEGMLATKRIEKSLGKDREEYINSLHEVHTKLSSQMSETSIKADIINSTINTMPRQQSSTSTGAQNTSIGIDLKGSITEFFKRAWVLESFRKQMLKPESGILTQQFADDVYAKNKESIDAERDTTKRERKHARLMYHLLDKEAKDNVKAWKHNLVQEESKIKDRNNTERVATSDDEKEEKEEA